MKTLDYRQFNCPYPVVETRKEMLANPGQVLKVQVTDQISCDNIQRLASTRNYQAAREPMADGFLLTLTPETGTVGPTPTEVIVANGKTVIFCGSERMGEGDEQLGQILLKNFFITLTDLDRLPEIILLVNSGVKLACSGSEALESLAALANRGVDIASCGLCLDFYQLETQLQVGRTTNMLEIAETKLQAARIIRP